MESMQYQHKPTGKIMNQIHNTTDEAHFPTIHITLSTNNCEVHLRQELDLKLRVVIVSIAGLDSVFSRNFYTKIHNNRKLFQPLGILLSFHLYIIGSVLCI
jgi:hypothetical protein